MESIQVIKQREKVDALERDFEKYNKTVARWFQMNPSSPEKNRLWQTQVITKLKVRELRYKLAYYDLEEMEGK